MPYQCLVCMRAVTETLCNTDIQHVGWRGQSDVTEGPSPSNDQSRRIRCLTKGLKAARSQPAQEPPCAAQSAISSLSLHGRCQHWLYTTASEQRRRSQQHPSSATARPHSESPPLEGAMGRPARDAGQTGAAHTFPQTLSIVLRVSRQQHVPAPPGHNFQRTPYQFGLPEMISCCWRHGSHVEHTHRDSSVRSSVLLGTAEVRFRFPVICRLSAHQV